MQNMHFYISFALAKIELVVKWDCIRTWLRSLGEVGTPTTPPRTREGIIVRPENTREAVARLVVRVQ